MLMSALWGLGDGCVCCLVGFLITSRTWMIWVLLVVWCTSGLWVVSLYCADFKFLYAGLGWVLWVILTCYCFYVESPVGLL